ncbi:MAG: hypothetical protein ABIL06_16205 [Pseudomonadota bacterium]
MKISQPVDQTALTADQYGVQMFLLHVHALNAVRNDSPDGGYYD